MHERPTSAGGALTEPHRGGDIVGSARMCSDGVEIGRCDAMAAAGRWATRTSGAWRSKHGSAGSAIASDAPLTLSRVRSSSGATVAFQVPRGSAPAQPNGRNGAATALRSDAPRSAASSASVGALSSPMPSAHASPCSVSVSSAPARARGLCGVATARSRSRMARR